MPTVPGFTDLTEIARGGSSVVYRCHEADTDRWVALKIIDAADASPHALESFRREALALGSLGDHPHIVTLYRTATLADHRPFLVLELCTTSIGRQIEERGALSARRCTAVAVKIAGALETVHRAGLLHLDVQPSNILITQYGEPALADFGLARLHAGSRAPFTLSGLITAHVAPEILSGRRATPAADVYQLASSIYHMVNGEPAFKAFDGELPASVAHRVLHEPVEPIALPDVPRELGDLLVWAMAKDPGARPASAAAFANALRAVELACGWVPTTAPAIPGGQLPLFTQNARNVLGETPQDATDRGTSGTSHPRAPYRYLVDPPTSLPAPSLLASPQPLPVPSEPDTEDCDHLLAHPRRSGVTGGAPERSSSGSEQAGERSRPRTATGLEAIVPSEERTRRFRRTRQPKDV